MLSRVLINLRSVCKTKLRTHLSTLSKMFRVIQTRSLAEKKNILLGKEHFNLKTCILTEIKNDFMLKNNFFKKTEKIKKKLLC